MRKTNVIEKALASIVNSVIAMIIASPFLFLTDNLLFKKLIIIGSFLVLNLLCVLFNDNRNLGMMMVGSDWQGIESSRQMIIFSFLYTLSFASLFFSIIFPGDLFIANIFIVQLGMVAITGTTLHGYLSGSLVSVKVRQ